MPLPESLSQPLRVCQVIVGALVMGCVSFGFVATFAMAGLPPGGIPLLTYVAVASIVPALVARFVVPPLIVSSIRHKLAGQPEDRERDVQQLWGGFQTSLIVGCALIEGSIFFILVSYMLEREPLSLGAAAAMLLLLAGHFPTAMKTGRWLDSQLEQLAQERSFHRT